MLLNVLDYPDAQSAIDAASDGDRIYFPGARTYEAPPEGWQVAKSLEIFGDGPGNLALNSGTILTSSTQSPGAGKFNDVIVLISPPGGTLPHVYIHDLTITRTAVFAPAIRDGIRWYSPDRPPPGEPSIPNSKISQVRLERLNIVGMGEVGVHLRGSDGGENAVVGLWMVNCTLEGCGHQGLHLRFATVALVIQCRFASNGSEGCWAEAVALAMYGCAFETNRTATPGVNGSADLLVSDESVPRIDACRFTNCTNGSGTRPPCACIISDCRGGGYIGGCNFVSCPLGLFLLNILSGIGMIILPNRFAFASGGPRTAIAVDVASEANMFGLVVLPQFAPSDAIINLPTGSDHSPISVPASNDSTVNVPAGLAIPAVQQLPTENEQEGELVFIGGELKVFCAAQETPTGDWWKVRFDP